MNILQIIITFISNMKTNIQSLKISMVSKYNKQIKHNQNLIAQIKISESLNYFLRNSNIKHLINNNKRIPAAIYLNHY